MVRLRGVLDYFDAHILGLTATPGKQTFRFFERNLVSEYTHRSRSSTTTGSDGCLF